MIRVIKEGEDYHDNKIRVRYIASINRSAPVEQASEMIQLALNYHEEQYLVGVELSGDPRIGKFEDFKE